MDNLEKRLALAVQKNDLVSVRDLLEQGADVKGNDNAPLALAAMSGHVEMCKLLLEKGAEVRLGGNALIFALYTSKTLFYLLLDHAFQPELWKDKSVATLDKETTQLIANIGQYRANQEKSLQSYVPGARLKSHLDGLLTEAVAQITERGIVTLNLIRRRDIEKNPLRPQKAAAPKAL